jgi:uncharacterized membrane protein
MTSLGRRLFAVALIAFGLLQFLYADLVTGRPPAWPAQLGAGWIWAYATGAWLVLAGAAMLADRYTRAAAWSIAVLVFVSALIRNLPLALADPTFGGAWTRLGKAVALTGGAVAMAASVRGRRPRVDVLAIVGRVALGMFLIASGVQHFLFPNAVMSLIPGWIPGALMWTYVAGVALIAGGAGLIVPRTTRLAGIGVGLMLLTWTVILHIPRALAAQPANQRNEWTAVFEALAFAGIALALTTPRSLTADRK